MATATSELSVLSLVVLSAVFGALGVAIFLVFWKRTPERKGKSADVVQSFDNSLKTTTEASKCTEPIKPLAATSKRKSNKEQASEHRLLLAKLKGHTDLIYGIDFSSNGKFLASCSEDRTVRLWNIKDFSEREHKYTRANIEFDHATAVSFSPDSKAFVVSLGVEQAIRVFKLSKKKDGVNSSMFATPEYDFPKVHKTEIISVGISSLGNFIMSASKDTTLVIWTLKGEVLEKVDTLVMYNSHAAISPCGNLVAACGFTSDVKMWEVSFKGGQFSKVSRALELKGHTAGVYSFSFTTGSKRVATVSKDGTWKIWDIDVNYQRGQEAYLLSSGNFNPPPEGVKVCIALSPDSFTVALGVGKSVSLWNASTAICEQTVGEAHPDNIVALAWYSDSRQLVSAGGRMIHVWHNPVGARAALLDFNAKLPKAKSDVMRERIIRQIAETKEYLKAFE